MSLERMCSAAIQPPSFHAQKLHFSLKSTVALQPNAAKSFRISAAAAAVLNPDPLSTAPPRKQKLGVVVKPAEKRRLVLKFIWMEKNIGISIDQVIPGYGTIPLSPYYFWPRKDAWEELKTLLESKSWISHKQIVILLNQATDIINLWQQSGGNFA